MLRIRSRHWDARASACSPSLKQGRSFFLFFYFLLQSLTQRTEISGYSLEIFMRIKKCFYVRKSQAYVCLYECKTREVIINLQGRQISRGKCWMKVLVLKSSVLMFFGFLSLVFVFQFSVQSIYCLTKNHFTFESSISKW